jgi:hypothetical protein
LHDETITNIFWGLFLVWFGVVSAVYGANFGTAIESPLFALGTGFLLLAMNLTRNLIRIRLSVITTGLGILLIIVYFPLYFLNISIPFLPALLVIAGVALIIGAIRTRKYHVSFKY